MCWAPTASSSPPRKIWRDLGLMKDFFDRTYYPALDRISAAALCHADLRGQRRPERAPARSPASLRLAPACIADPLLVCTHAQTPEAILAPKMIGAADLAAVRGIGGGDGGRAGNGVF